MIKTLMVREDTQENPSFCSYSIGFYKPYVSCRKSDLTQNPRLFSKLLFQKENILLDGYDSQESSIMIAKAESLGYNVIKFN